MPQANPLTLLAHTRELLLLLRIAECDFVQNDFGRPAAEALEMIDGEALQRLCEGDFVVLQLTDKGRMALGDARGLLAHAHKQQREFGHADFPMLKTSTSVELLEHVAAQRWAEVVSSSEDAVAFLCRRQLAKISLTLRGRHVVEAVIRGARVFCDHLDERDIDPNDLNPVPF